MALALYLVLSFLSYSNAQEVLTTGNLVNFTGTPTSTTGNWVNGVYVQQLGCFGGNTPGNCGPYPSVQTNGNINFSYGQVNLNQVVNINNALAAAGTGIQLSGFNFGFRAKNGNGWDDGRQDYLSAYVNIYNSSGKIVENYDYTNYTNRKYNWSDFSFHETFNKPYDISKLGAAQFGFIGKDNNYWAGPYGPEITNVSFSLNYKIDPCVTNPASSPSCPGFSNLIKSTNVIVPSGTSITNLSPTDTASSGTPTVNVGGVQLSTSGAISVPDNIPQALKDVQAATQQSTSQAAIGSSTQQQQSSSKPNMSLIMSLIGQIQAADKATQNAAIQNANQVVATSSAKAQEQSMATVDTLNTMSMASSQASQDRFAQSLQSPISIPQPTASIPQTSASISAVKIQEPTITALQSLMTTSAQSLSPVSSATQIEQIYQPNISAPSIFSMAAAYSASKNQDTSYNDQQISSLLEVQPVAETSPVQVSKIENKTLDVEMPLINATSMPKGTSVTEIAETKVNVDAAQTEQKTETVKKNVQSNELAGGVDIAALAIQPKGFDVYATTIIRDNVFYAPKDIYGNQKTIDNARALRQLSSDRLHQEMIDQQYRR